MAQAQWDVDPRDETRSGDGTVGVVLAGAGARGAYEAGILSKLLPALEIRNERPTVFVGMSAGAINAALFASLAHLPAEQAAERALHTWLSIDKHDVFRPVSLSLSTAAVRYVAGLFNVHLGRTGGLLDTAPLWRSVERKVDWRQLHENISERRVRAVALATTSCRTGLTEVFIESRDPLRLPRDVERAVDYVDVEEGLAPEHVVASASIPLVFPPVRLHQRRRGTSGWYMDGAVRLNAPIKPVIELGAEKVVVVATDPEEYAARSSSQEAGRPPLVQDSCAQLLNGALVDRMIEDMRLLSKINQLAEVDPDAKSTAGRPYRVVEHLFAGPAPGCVDELGRIANEVVATDFAGARALSHLDLQLLSTFIGPTASRGELLSYVLFEREFIEAAIEMGRRDADRILRHADGGNHLWRV